MGRCAKCGRTYDASWKVCLICGSSLMGNQENDAQKTESRQEKPGLKFRYNFLATAFAIICHPIALLLIILAILLLLANEPSNKNYSDPRDNPDPLVGYPIGVSP